MAQPVVIDKRQMEACFDGAAATYDAYGGQPFARWGERLVELLGVRPGERVLDVATGRGAVLLPAARAAGATGHVTGTDLSAAMVAATDAAAAREGLSNVTVLQRDAERLDFPAASFDVVTCAFSLFMFHDIAAAVAGMQRACRAGGRIGFTLFSRMPPPFDPGWRLFAEQAVAYGVATRVPQRVAYEPEEAIAALEALGTGSLTCIKEVGDVRFEDEEAWWSFQLTLGARVTILTMDAETRARFKLEHLQRFRDLQPAGPLVTSAGVIYVLGRG